MYSVILLNLDFNFWYLVKNKTEKKIESSFIKINTIFLYDIMLYN
jgi:hypothetical protein